MKHISTNNYRTDRYYQRVVKAVDEILESSTSVAPVEVFVRMQLLTREALEDWRRGRVPYLEKLIHTNLARASRILRILALHAHDLKLRPVPTDYRRWGRGPKTPLRFTKYRDAKLEEVDSRHFVRTGKKAASKTGPPPSEQQAMQPHLSREPDPATERFSLG